LNVNFNLAIIINKLLYYCIRLQQTLHVPTSNGAVNGKNSL